MWIRVETNSTPSEIPGGALGWLMTNQMTNMRNAFRSSSGPAGTNELIVVTLLVAVEGGVKIPNVTSLEELRTALNRLGSIGKDQVGY